MSTTTPLPSEEQKARAKWDLLLADLELRAEQIRQMKRFEPWRLAAALLLTGFGTAAAVIGATVALVKLLGI